jgi:hypothetical protein
MKNIQKYVGEWVLRNIKDNKILSHDLDFIKIHEESQKYPINEVLIEQRLEHGTRFF